MDYKIGDKFINKTTTPFGKEVQTMITLVAISGDMLLFDNGRKYHRASLK